jgi:hypothetical protein
MMLGCAGQLRRKAITAECRSIESTTITLRQMNIGLEIVGVFLFVGGFMYLVLSGRLADMFRDRAPKPLLLIALITGCALYHWATILSEPLPMPEQTAALPAAEVPAPPPAPVAVKRPARAATLAHAPEPPPASETEHGKMIIFDEYAPKEVFVPQATDPQPALAATPPVARPGPDPYESKAKRGIKTMGRFLHLRKPDR